MGHFLLYAQLSWAVRGQEGSKERLSGDTAAGGGSNEAPAHQLAHLTWLLKPENISPP